MWTRRPSACRSGVSSAEYQRRIPATSDVRRTRKPEPTGVPICLGVLAPLSPPGWIDAGMSLIAGVNLAVSDINRQGGIAGRPLETIVRDTNANPRQASDAVDELASLGVAGVIGEYHSVAARSAAVRCEEIGLPYLCSSAVLDDLVDGPSSWVARLSPPQSLGWRHYAEFLLASGHDHIAVGMQESAYWVAGLKILRAVLESRGRSLSVLDLGTRSTHDVLDELVRNGASILLLLAGHPIPIVHLVEAVRADPRLSSLRIGAPAGQPELSGWSTPAGDLGTAIPFLRYMPASLTPLGKRVAEDLRRGTEAEISFVSLEDYDSVLVAASAIQASAERHGPKREFWRNADVLATRGHITLAPPAGRGVWQWRGAPVQIAERDPAMPIRLRIVTQF